jgi:hypothetical protein
MGRNINEAMENERRLSANGAARGQRVKMQNAGANIAAPSINRPGECRVADSQ